MSWRETWACIKESGEAWNQDNVPRLAASLAFYALLSLAPLVVIAVGIAARAFGREAVTGELTYRIETYVGPEAASTVQAILSGAYSAGPGAVATWVGVVVLLYGASSVVVDLQDSLNTIWHVAPRQGSASGAFLRMIGQRFFAFLLVFGAGAILTLSLLISSGIAALGKSSSAGVSLTLPPGILQAIAFCTSFAVTALMFGAIYKLLPEVKLRWSDAAIGAAVTALLFCIGKEAIALYLGKTTFASAYGAAGSLAVLLIWVYYSAQLFFLGSEFTKVYVRRFGSRVPQRPAPNSCRSV